jgi:hypothetical protein
MAIKYPWEQDVGVITKTEHPFAGAAPRVSEAVARVGGMDRVVSPIVEPSTGGYAFASLPRPAAQSTERPDFGATARPEIPVTPSSSAVGIGPVDDAKPRFADANGDGIPDGAEITRTVTHMGPGGAQIKDSMFYVKGAPAAGAGSASIMPSRTMTAEEALGLRRDQFVKKAGNLGLPGAERKAAGQEIKGIDEQLRRLEAEKRYDKTVQQVTDRELEKARLAKEGQQARADATRYAAEVGGKSREKSAGIMAEAKQQALEAQQQWRDRKLTLEEAKAADVRNQNAFTNDIKQRLAESALGAKWKGELPPYGHEIPLSTGEILVFSGKVDKNGAPQYIKSQKGIYSFFDESSGVRPGGVSSDASQKLPIAAQPAADKPPRPGQWKGQVARDKNTGQTFTWDGSDWI